MHYDNVAFYVVFDGIDIQGVWYLWGKFSWAATADSTKTESPLAFLTFRNSQRDIHFLRLPNTRVRLAFYWQVYASGERSCRLAPRAPRWWGHAHSVNRRPCAWRHARLFDSWKSADILCSASFPPTPLCEQDTEARKQRSTLRACSIWQRKMLFQDYKWLGKST